MYPENGPRRIEEEENRMQPVEIAEEKDEPKGQPGAYFDEVGESQSEIEGSPKFEALPVQGGCQWRRCREEGCQGSGRAAPAPADLVAGPHDARLG